MGKQYLGITQMFELDAMTSLFDSDEEDEAHRLDSATVAMLESMLPQKAKELLEYLKSKRKITIYDRKKDPTPLPEHPRAFTYHYDNRSDIWLTADDDHVIDSFVHEIGQVYVSVLGYNQISLEPSANDKILEFAMNAFVGTIAELKLEKYGIDRSSYKERVAKDFEIYLRKMPFLDHGRPEVRVMSCFMYIAHALLLDNFSRLDDLWKQKTVNLPQVRQMARKIFLEASKQEITPERYAHLQRFFVESIA